METYLTDRVGSEGLLKASFQLSYNQGSGSVRLSNGRKAPERSLQTYTQRKNKNCCQVTQTAITSGNQLTCA